MDIQKAPYCEGASKGKREQDEFYVGTVQQICIIINNLTLYNYTITFNPQEKFAVNPFE